MKKIRVGIIGCGAIGSALARVLDREYRRVAALRYVCDIHPEKAARVKKEISGRVAVAPLKKLIRGSDLIIEAASAAASARIAADALKQNKQVLVMSVGGLLMRDGWLRYVKKGQGKVWIPSGAVTGIDGLLAARERGIRRVCLVTRKPPASLKQAPYFLKKKFPVLKSSKAVCLFRGTAHQAVTAFPQNINVAAVLSLAGIGAKKTYVEIWTSRAYHHNQHEVIVDGPFGKIRTLTLNLPSEENPKTSALAIFSAMATLRKIFSTIQIGS